MQLGYFRKTYIGTGEGLMAFPKKFAGNLSAEKMYFLLNLSSASCPSCCFQPCLRISALPAQACCDFMLSRFKTFPRNTIFTD